MGAYGSEVGKDESFCERIRCNYEDRCRTIWPIYLSCFATGPSDKTGILMSTSESKRKMDDVLRRMLSTPPAPQPGKPKPQPKDTKKTGQ